MIYRHSVHDIPSAKVIGKVKVCWSMYQSSHDVRLGKKKLSQDRFSKVKTETKTFEIQELFEKQPYRTL